jgi:hypothetical protein
MRSANRLPDGSLFKSSMIGSHPGTPLKLVKVERTERPDKFAGIPGTAY